MILSGDPFSVYTRVLETWVEGEKVFDLDDPEDRKVAEGAYGAMQPAVAAQHFHGYGEGHTNAVGTIIEGVRVSDVKRQAAVRGSRRRGSPARQPLAAQALHQPSAFTSLPGKIVQGAHCCSGGAW